LEAAKGDHFKREVGAAGRSLAVRLNVMRLKTGEFLAAAASGNLAKACCVRQRPR